MSSYKGYNLFDIENNNAGFIPESGVNSSDSLDFSENSTDFTNGTSQYRNAIPVITIVSEDEEEEGNETKWAELPSLAVENIYSFLSRTDQSRMSVVCSRWAKDFNSPKLWKTMRFYLPEQRYYSGAYPEVRFAQKYSSMFQHVEVICKRVKSQLIGVIWRQLKLFLKAMASSSQLTSIKFINMGNYFLHLDDILRQDLFKAFIKFFYSQKNLKTVAFENSRFTKEESMKLLKAILHSDNSSVKNLKLRRFVNEDNFMGLRCQYMSNLSEVCGRIAYVQSFEVDYTETFEDVINCMYEQLSTGDYQLDKKKPCLSNLTIHCDNRRQLPYKGILPEAWKNLAKIFSGLKVKIVVTIRNILKSETEKFLMREIPLQTLDFRSEKVYTSPRIDIGSLFTHFQICKYEKHLEVLNVCWMSSLAGFAESVVSFIQSCQKLQIFHLHVNNVPSEIENILKSFLENHPLSLKSITIWLENNREGIVEDSLAALSEEYYPLFNEQGIEFFLVVEPSRRSRRRNPIVDVS